MISVYNCVSNLTNQIGAVYRTNKSYLYVYMNIAHKKRIVDFFTRREYSRNSNLFKHDETTSKINYTVSVFVR